MRIRRVGRVVVVRGGMVFFRVRNATIFSQYLEQTRDELAIDFPAEYFEKGWSFVAFDEGKVVAGYSLILEGPFRVLSSVPLNINNLEVISSLNKSSVEITGFWISKEARNPKAILAILHSMSENLNKAYEQFGKRHAVYAYGFEDYQLKRIYRRAQPTTIFSGLTLQQIGMAKPEHENIEFIDILALQSILDNRYAKVQRWL